jgi:hypothetical protein
MSTSHTVIPLRARAQGVRRGAAALVVTLGLTASHVARADAPEERLLSPSELRWDFSTDAPREGIGLETSLLWPIYPGTFFQLRATIPVWPGHGELLVGAQGRLPEDRPDEGRFHNLDAQLGWRQYFAWGLHLDAIVNAGWGRVSNSTITGQDYDSFDLEAMAVAGWRYSVGPLYAAIQPLGIAAVVYKSNPWPIRGEGSPRTEGPIYVGNILFGVLF